MAGMSRTPSHPPLRPLRALALAALGAASLAGIAAARSGTSSACPAQIAARQEAEPGFVVLAGDGSNPACTGRHKTRRAAR